MAGNAQVTEGVCLRLNTAVDAELQKLENSSPQLQILSIKKIGQTANSAGNQDRYRAIVSDGDHFMQAMLATQMNPLVENGQIVKHSIVRLDKFSVNGVKENKRYASFRRVFFSVLTCATQITHSAEHDYTADECTEGWRTFSARKFIWRQTSFYFWHTRP